MSPITPLIAASDLVLILMIVFVYYGSGNCIASKREIMIPERKIYYAATFCKIFDRLDAGIMMMEADG